MQDSSINPISLSTSLNCGIYPSTLCSYFANVANLFESEKFVLLLTPTSGKSAIKTYILLSLQCTTDPKVKLAAGKLQHAPSLRLCNVTNRASYAVTKEIQFTSFTPGITFIFKAQFSYQRLFSGMKARFYGLYLSLLQFPSFMSVYSKMFFYKTTDAPIKVHIWAVVKDYYRFKTPSVSLYHQFMIPENVQSRITVLVSRLRRHYLELFPPTIRALHLLSAPVV